MGVTVEPFVTPLTSEGLPRSEKEVTVEVGTAPVTVRVTDLLDAPRVAVTVALWPEAAAAATKVELLDPAGTSTEPGTIKTDTGLTESETDVPPVGAVVEITIVQVVEPATARLVLPHCKDVICTGVAGATSETLAVLLTAFKLAVTLAT